MQAGCSWRVVLHAAALFWLATIAHADGNLRVLLNDPLAYRYPENSCTSVVCRPLLAAIEGAQQSIDFAIYGMRNQDAILEALIKAKRRGVRVRGVIDRDVDGGNRYSSTEKLIAALGDVKSDYATDLRRQEEERKKREFRPYCQRPEGFLGPLQCVGYSLSKDTCIVSAMASREPIVFKGDIMHNKFFIIDGRIVWTGSANLSDSGTGGYNANIALLIENSEVASFYSLEFEQMYTLGRYHREKTLFRNKFLRARVGRSVVDISFSPQGNTMESLVRPLIKGADRYIDVSMFFLTHTKLAGDLINAHQRGVKIRVIIDATAASNGYSKHEILRAVGIPVKVENWGGKMHMKSAVIDGRYVIAGSMNWTAAGERKNDENTVIIHDPDIAGEVRRFFDHMWASIPDRWLSGRPDPESRDSSMACQDGMDNDFDNLVDTGDPGCSVDPPPLPPLPPYRIVRKVKGNGLVKGNISRGRKIYILPNSKYYRKARIDLARGEMWFCSVYDARENGWRSYREYLYIDR